MPEEGRLEKAKSWTAESCLVFASGICGNSDRLAPVSKFLVWIFLIRIDCTCNQRKWYANFFFSF